MSQVEVIPAVLPGLLGLMHMGYLTPTRIDASCQEAVKVLSLLSGTANKRVEDQRFPLQ